MKIARLGSFLLNAVLFCALLVVITTSNAQAHEVPVVEKSIEGIYPSIDAADQAAGSITRCENAEINYGRKAANGNAPAGSTFEIRLIYQAKEDCAEGGH